MIHILHTPIYTAFAPHSIQRNTQHTQEPLPMLRALPSPNNLLEWHYVLEGSEDSYYAGGFYHGKLIFPTQYPFKPPSIIMLTPSGRFVPGSRICLSLSDFHPETWSPMWDFSKILLGLQSFFYENQHTTGAMVNVPKEKKAELAAQSLAFNVKNPTFRKLFPELVQLHEQQRLKEEEKDSSTADQIQHGGGGDGVKRAFSLLGIEGTGWKDVLIVSAVAVAFVALLVAALSKK